MTQFGVSKAEDSDKNPIEDPHVVGTSLDLSYTGDGALNETYAAINGNSSAVRLVYAVGYDYDFEQDVLDAYDPSKPGDCSRPLGAACVRALEKQHLSQSSIGGLKVGIPECEDTLSGLHDELEDDYSIASIPSASTLLKSSTNEYSGTVLLTTCRPYMAE